MRRRVPQVEQVLSAVERRAGDGYCRRDDLEVLEFPKTGSRDFLRGVRRAVSGGYLISHRHRGRTHLALAPEGWAVLRGEVEAPR